VDDDATENYSLSILVGPDGDPRIGYLARARVLLASRSSGKWEIERVGWGDYEAVPTLGIDRDGGLHASWADSDDDSILYSYSDGTGWREERVDDGGAPRLAVEPSGVPHVIYFNGYFTGPYVLASRAESGWTVEPFLGDLWEGGLVDYFVADEDGHLHVALNASSGAGTPFNGVAYATNAGGSWTREEVVALDETIGIADRIALATDSEGLAYLAWSPVPGDIYYATNRDGGWRTSRVTATSGFVDDSIALAVDTDGTVHMVWQDWQSDPTVISALHHGTLASHGWDFETVKDVDERLITAMTISGGVLHLAYAGWVGGEVRYLSRRVSCP
jgi:hypothetical protein